MSTGFSVVSALITIAVLLILYRFVFNPQIVTGGSKSGASTCPAAWSYMDGKCMPPKGSVCAPFDPSKITSVVEACNTARACGSDWPGMCA